ncbi:rhomboid family intramembrane serine protease [Roseibacillus persicicus]|uniref:rhomboid family intramembrane serine protease n=1 Tax=Roseibacillus persicicus TaxID=454148 RepID=UPI00280F442F|nr:rhomboid family intramembrane serine protease [Roseibacillus persicicus]MDQ8189284.1 rhomboid family intramembrane serine protease [Roseibacillus persicicus]
MVTTFVAQLISFGAMADAMAFPARIEAALEHLRAGEATAADWQTFSTLLTAAFMHGGWDHILFNMLFLWIFAGLIVDLMGWRWMLGLFLATAIAGSIGDVILRSGSPVPALGASGAVMGFEGAYLGLAVRWKLPWPHIFPMAHPIPPARLGILAVVGFILDISGVIGPSTGVAHGAHLGGFITGLFLTSFVAPRPQALRSR